MVNQTAADPSAFPELVKLFVEGEIAVAEGFRKEYQVLQFQALKKVVQGIPAVTFESLAHLLQQVAATDHLQIVLDISGYQGTSGNLPLAAALTVVPMAIMVVYLLAARKFGAFDAL